METIVIVARNVTYVTKMGQNIVRYNTIILK